MRGSMSPMSVEVEQGLNYEQNEISKALFSSLVDELDDASKYLELAEKACDLENQSLKQSMINLANQEIAHFDEIKKEVEKMYPEMKHETLYVLYKNMIDWRDEISEDLAEFR